MKTIAARLKREPLELKDALRYAAQILAALTEAHEKGTIHRDLKAGNIMIAKGGVKVLDFGLAKSEQDDTLTASHVVMGTPASWRRSKGKASLPTLARTSIRSDVSSMRWRPAREPPSSESVLPRGNWKAS